VEVIFIGSVFFYFFWHEAAFLMNVIKTTQCITFWEFMKTPPFTSNTAVIVFYLK